MIRLIYNLLLPIGFLFYVPGLLIKYRSRGGWKKTFGERFGNFSIKRIQELKEFHGAIWVHAVSVGEAVIALAMIQTWHRMQPDRKFIISTTTTTGQELARQQDLPGTTVIFSPIDFWWMVRRTLNVLKPAMLVIFETEIWPNIICETSNRGIPIALVNARMSDHSAQGYRRARFFFSKLLQRFSLISAQSEMDAERFKSISPKANISVAGNLKFDQKPPENLPDPEYGKYFGNGKHLVLLAASTHSGEEELIAETFKKLKGNFSHLRLVLVPRHAERGADIAEMLEKKHLKFARRSYQSQVDTPVDVLLADTTGEMLKLMNGADIVIMGKSLAGHDEGHNLIEPALLGKPIVTGCKLRNFRFILKVLQDANAVVTITSDSDLEVQLRRLLSNRELCQEIGNRAGSTIRKHTGATERTINNLEALFNK